MKRSLCKCCNVFVIHIIDVCCEVFVVHIIDVREKKIQVNNKIKAKKATLERRENQRIGCYNINF